MKIKLSNRSLRWLLLALCIVWMIVIFYFSALPAEVSSQQSGGIVSLISGFFGGEANSSQADLLEVVIRKIAHVAEFTVLGALWCGYYYASSKESLSMIYAVVVSVVYAVCDETHQIFVPGRAARFYDVCLDIIGILLGVLVVYYVFRRHKKWKQK